MLCAQLVFAVLARDTSATARPGSMAPTAPPLLVPPPPRPGTQGSLAEPLLPHRDTPARNGRAGIDRKAEAGGERHSADDVIGGVQQVSAYRNLLYGGDNGSRLQQAGQVSKVLANLINSGIGTSTVAMPLAVWTLGVGVAVGAMLLQAVLGVLANHIISRESDRENAGSYHDLMCSRYGKWGGRGVAVAQMVNSLGKTVVWLIILADLIVGSSGDGTGLLPELLQATGHGDLASSGAWYMRRWPWILLLAATAMPVVSVRSLDKLSGVSLLGDAAVTLMAVTGLVLTGIAVRQGKAHGIHWLPNKENAGVSSPARLALEVVSVIPIMMGAAFTQNNINSVMGELRPYRQGVLDFTQTAARVVTIAVFLTIGISNYVVFGPDLKPDVLVNYSAASLGGLLAAKPALYLSAAVKLAFLINGLVSLPMYLWPYQHNLWAALPRESPEARMSDPRSFALTNIASLAGCTLVALLVPSIWKPLKLLGGTAVSCMAFVFPGLIVLRSQGSSGRTGWDRALWALGWVLVAVGLLQAAASIVSQFT